MATKQAEQTETIPWHAIFDFINSRFNPSKDLARVVNAWPTLPAADRKRIVAMVKAAKKGGA